MKSSIDRLKQKIEERNALLPSGGRDRQAALPHLTPGPEVALAPEHGGTAGLLGLVAPMLDSLHLDEGPNVLPQSAQFGCKRLGLRVAAVLGHVEHLGVTGLDQFLNLLQRAQVQRFKLQERFVSLLEEDNIVSLRGLFSPLSGNCTASKCLAQTERSSS